MYKFNRHRRGYIPFLTGILTLFIAGQGFAQQTGELEGQALYDALKAFELQGKATVSGLNIKRDRGEMTFTGDLYFAAPVNGRVTGAVFIGEGTFRAEAPPIEYEKESLIRFLDTDVVESDFKTAVLRFTDDTLDLIKKSSSTEPIPDQALDLAKDFEPRLLEETGVNMSARLAISLENNESPGVFLAQFDKGKLDRFTFLLDPQTLILTNNFGINGGEKVVVFRYESYAYTNDLWIATYAEEDFEKGQVNFSDEFDVVNPLNYRIEVNLLKARRILRTKMRIDFESLVDNLRAIPMVVNDGITAYDNKRLEDSMRVQSAQYQGQDIPCIQEDWEVGLTFLLPKPMQKGEKFSIEVALDGDFIDKQDTFVDIHFLQSNTNWYPRHGYLKRSTFDLIFRHQKNYKVASVGSRIREEASPEDDDIWITEYRMDDPVSFASFSAGQMQYVTQERKLAFGDMELQFFSVPKSGDYRAVDEDFILAELGNALNYFSNLFGPYPYKNFRASVFPFSAGQGLPTLLMLANATEANRETFKFLSHETSHQWWGNFVAWRSYRDQWLSEGFAEYSGLLYVLFRMQNPKEQREFLDVMRYGLKSPPRTDTGVGKGKVAEIGPLILGRRLRTRNSMNAYQQLTYDKGALVLRMLHYLFSDPYSGNDALFYRMMKDFVTRFANKTASTNDFVAVANAYFAQAPLAKNIGLKDLNWFFQQWVYQAKLPSYRMEYKIEEGEGDQVSISGKILQTNAGENWIMPLPVVMEFSGDQKAQAFVWANGPEANFQLPPLPMKPKSVKLDPDWWILSEKTETKKK
ncbi:MAG: M1 family aminopeptidase [Acidobacteriota bacterium]|jgi:hypothetical protein